MADNNIKFTIGSDFQDSGFTAAKQSIGDINKQVKSGARDIAGFAQSFGVLDGQAAKAASALTGLLSAAMTLNPITIGITAAISALSWAMNECREREEKLRKEQEEHRKAMENLLTITNNGLYQAAIEEAKQLGNEYMRITTHANEMTAAINALNNERASGGVLQLQADKIVAVFNEVTEEGKQLVASEYDLKIATAQAAQARAAAEAKLEEAHNAVAQQEGKIANLVEQRAALEKRLQTMQENNAQVHLAEKSVREKVLAQIQEMQNKIDGIDANIAREKEKLEVAIVKEQTAVEARANAETSISSKEYEAEAKHDALVEAIEARKNAEAEAAEAAKETAELDAQIAADKQAQEDELKEYEQSLAEATQDLTATRNQLASVEQSLAAAEAAYQKKLNDYNDTTNLTNVAAREQVANTRGLKGGMLDGGTQKKIIDLNVKGKLQEAVNGGKVNSVKDMQRFERQAQREARNDISKAQRQALREAQEYDRLKKLNPKLLSKQDKDFLDKMDQLRAQDEKKKGELDKAKNDVEKAREDRRKVIEKLDKINEQLKGLGAN